MTINKMHGAMPGVVTLNKKAAGSKSTTATRSICTVDPTAALVQAHGNSLWTNARLIAIKFEKRHANVIRAIENLDCSREFHQLNFESVEYSDEGGKPRKSYDISRDGFSLLAMGFTGQGAAKWKEQFIAAFGKMERELLRNAARKNDPALRSAAQEKSACATLMTDCLVDVRKTMGKETKRHHFVNEHGMCNWVLTGTYDTIEDHALDKPAMQRMSAIRRHNTMLIVQGIPYAKRKKELREKFPLVNVPLLELQT